MVIKPLIQGAILLLDLLISLLYLPYLILSCVACLAFRRRGSVFMRIGTADIPADADQRIAGRFTDPAWPDLFERQIEVRFIGRNSTTSRSPTASSPSPCHDGSRSLIFRKRTSRFMVCDFLRSFLALFRMTRARGLALVHAEQCPDTALAAWLIARLSGTLFSYGIDEELDESARFGRRWLAPSGKFQRYLARFLIRHADFLLLSIPGLRDYALRSGASPNRIHDAPLHLDSAPFIAACDAARRQSEPSSRVFHMVYCGVIAREKRVFDLVEIAKACRLRNFEVKFEIHGEGPDELELRRAFEESNLQTDVVIHGRYDEDHLPGIMAHADLLFIPAGNRSCMQGAWSGTPVIYYGDCHGHQFLEDNVSGFRVHRDDITSIVKIIQCLIGDAELKRRMGRKAQDAASRLYNPAVVLESRKKLFASMCGVLLLLMAACGMGCATSSAALSGSSPLHAEEYRLDKWKRGLRIRPLFQSGREMFLWFYEWNLFDAFATGEMTQGEWRFATRLRGQAGTSGPVGHAAEILSEETGAPGNGIKLDVKTDRLGAEMLLTVTNRSDHDWGPLAAIVPCFNPGPAPGSRKILRRPRTTAFLNDRTYCVTDQGLERMKGRAIYFHDEMIPALKAHSPGGVFAFSHLWPSTDTPVKSGLLIRESEDGSWSAGIVWERSLAVQANNEWDCMHSIIHIGPLARGESRTIRGRIFLLPGDKDDLFRRWRNAT